MTTAAELISVLASAGMEPSSYSGRGMFGRQCVSVSGESLWTVARVTSDMDVSEPSTDSMGCGIVIYWPGLAWPEEQTEQMMFETVSGDMMPVHSFSGGPLLIDLCDNCKGSRTDAIHSW